MRDYHLVFGGLESGYMKKLTIYIQNRLKHRVKIDILEETDEISVSDFCLERTLWVGTWEFLEHLKGEFAELSLEMCVVLWEEQTDDGQHLCRYQSCEKLYRGIFRRFQKVGIRGSSPDTDRDQEWITFVTDTSPSALLAFTLTCARILSGQKRVLYINFSECCGMKELLEVEPQADLSDLLLALRMGEEIVLDEFTGQLEELCYILPPANPMIQREITKQDAEKLFALLRSEKQYDVILFALGNAFCGCDSLLAESRRVILLTQNEFEHQCAGREWERFVRLCLSKQVEPEFVKVPLITSKNCDVSCLNGWIDGELGVIAQNCMLKKGDGSDEICEMAGDPE